MSAVYGVMQTSHIQVSGLTNIEQECDFLLGLSLSLTLMSHSPRPHNLTWSEVDCQT